MTVSETHPWEARRSATVRRNEQHKLSPGCARGCTLCVNPAMIEVRVGTNCPRNFSYPVRTRKSIHPATNLTSVFVVTPLPPKTLLTRGAEAVGGTKFRKRTPGHALQHCLGGKGRGVKNKTEVKFVAGLTACIIKALGNNVRVKTNDTLKDFELICCQMFQHCLWGEGKRGSIRKLKLSLLPG